MRFASKPPTPGTAIFREERKVARERFDYVFWLSGEAWSESATWLDGVRRFSPILIEDIATTDDMALVLKSKFTRRQLDVPDALTHECYDFVSVAELGWDANLEDCRARHRAVAAEEMARPLHHDLLSRNEIAIRVDARPMEHALDQTVLDGIRQGIDDLFDHRFVIDEACDAWFLRCPEVLPTATKLVLASRDETMEVLDEHGHAAMPIKNYGVVMVRLDGTTKDIDFETCRSDR